MLGRARRGRAGHRDDITPGLSEDLHNKLGRLPTTAVWLEIRLQTGRVQRLVLQNKGKPMPAKLQIGHQFPFVGLTERFKHGNPLPGSLGI